MSIFKKLSGAILALGFAAGVAQAAPVDFEVGGATNVQDISGCFGCSIDIDLAAGLIGNPFALEEGESETFAFFDITADTTWFVSGGLFGVAATLELDPPGGIASSLGGGAFLNAFGSITLGALVWDQDVFSFNFGNGGQYTVAFDQGVALILGAATTINATVTLDVAPAPVPLPAGALLLLGGLGGFGVLRARRRIAA